MPDVSVIIPNLHSPVIGDTLASLERQTYAGTFEVIVVGQDRHGLVQERPGLRHIVTPEPASPAKARNIGIRAAAGDILAFIDADCVAAPDWLACLTAPYAFETVSVVGGSVEFPEENYWTLCDNVAAFHDYLPSNPPGFPDMLPTINLSVRRSILSEVGLFDEAYGYLSCEDANFTTRLRLHGYRLLFDPRARVSHLPPGRRDLATLLKKSYAFGTNSIKTDPRFREAHRVPRLLHHWWAMVLLSPGLALSVVLNIVFKNHSGLHYWSTFPVVYFLKWVWCLGAARTLWRNSAPG